MFMCIEAVRTSKYKSINIFVNDSGVNDSGVNDSGVNGCH